MILPPSAAIDLQSNSPLFQLIPQEVRKLIWQHAATAYSNPEVEHRQDSHFFRPPEYTHHKLRSTDWLRTCRLVYREAWDMPGRLNVHAFWADIERSPMEAGVLNKDGLYQAGPFKESDMRYWRFRGIMVRTCRPPGVRNQFQQMHLLTQQYWLEDIAKHATPEFMAVFAYVESLKITVRRSDWWFWERDEALGIDPRGAERTRAQDMYLMWDKDDQGEQVQQHPHSWGEGIKKMFPSLKMLEIELETVVEKEGELQVIADRALRWKFDTSRGSVLEAEQFGKHDGSRTGIKPPSWRTWTGPKCMHTMVVRRTDDSPGPQLIVASIRYRET